MARDIDDAGRVTRADVSKLLDRAQRLAEQERLETAQNSWKYNELIAYQRQVVLAERDKILREDGAALKAFEALQDADGVDGSVSTPRDPGPGRLQELRRALGAERLAAVCKSVMLFELDGQWSDHLALLSEQRAAIHLRSLGRQNPLDEFRRETISAFDGFFDRVNKGALESLGALEVVDRDVDLEAAGLRRGSTTWTYVANENPFGSQSDQAVKWLLKKMGR